MARLAVLVVLVARRDDIAQRRRGSVMQVRRSAINSEQCRRVVLRAHAFALVQQTRADVVQVERLLQAAVAVIRAAMARGAADVLTHEHFLAALGLRRQLAWAGGVRR